MRLFALFFFLLCFSTNAQNDILAKEYFNKGEFEKALVAYKKLFKKNKKNRNYLLQLVKTHQQLEQFKEAEILLSSKLGTSRNSGPFMVELGYNYQLQKDTINAKINYTKAIAIVDSFPNSAYTIGRAFENYSLLSEAITTYENAMTQKPDLNFNMQLARIYGEQGDIEKMFNSYINFGEKNKAYINTIKRSISQFISENGANENNVILRKILLKKIQSEPNLIWNDMLSWLFIQQKDYKKAFTQEKAIYKRELESLDRIQELAVTAKSQNKNEIAKIIFTFIIENSQEIDDQLSSHYYLLEIETKEASKKEYKTIQEKYLALFEEQGKFPATLDLQIAYAHFLAFYLKNTSEAISFLKETLKLELSKFKIAKVKLELGDILVLEEKFNEALIYYTQIQRSLKNSTISQQARFKVAKTSYYKGDFKWAESQLKVLKASTTQLTANDALDLKLLIADNRQEDSLQINLKKYAKADLLAFQNRRDESINLLKDILNTDKTAVIIPQALIKQAKLFEEKQDYESAKKNYERLINEYKESILVDDAIYYLAEIFAQQLTQPEKAKELYEKIIFDHADSIFFVDSRKKYRALRGDAIN